MLFLHGFPEFWYAWSNQLREFARDHTVVAPDMRGYNLSSKPADVGEYRVKCLVADVRALAEHLGFERFTLVGHDWGGVVAWAFALAHPQMLDRLVIINAPHPAIFVRELRDNPAQQQASQYMLFFRSPKAEEVLLADGSQRLVGMVMGRGLQQGFFDERDREAYLAAWSQPGALTGGLNYYRASGIGPATPAASTPNETTTAPAADAPAPQPLMV
ncbi:MAG TPA: alpha/beta hydrolase, partial [Chloroflexota bacterium]|nr:alpha/beta hydrolase [Chloroflexota bacterium]